MKHTFIPYNIPNKTTNGIIYFGREDKLHLLGKLYIQTAQLNQAYLRDLYFNGIAMGRTKEFINGIRGVKSIKQRINENSMKSLNLYFNFLRNLTDYSKVSFINVKNFLGTLCTIYDLPDFSIMISMTFFYGDLTLFPDQQYWLKRISENESNVVNSQQFLEDLNPYHQMGKAAFGDGWPLNIGAIADSIFGVVWGKLFPQPNPYVKAEDFKREMDKLYNDLKKYVDKEIPKAIDSEIKIQCDLRFKSIQFSGENYKNELTIFNQRRKNKEPIDQNLISALMSYSAIFHTKLLEGMIYFGREDKLHLLGKLYIQTAQLNQAYLRDLYFNGIAMGRTKEFIYGTKGLKSIKQRINENSVKAINLYYKLIWKLTERSKVSYKYLHGYSGFQCRVYDLPDFSIMISMTFFYGDLTLFPDQQYWLKRISEKGLSSYFVPKTNNNNAKKSILTIDFKGFSKLGKHNFPEFCDTIAKDFWDNRNAPYLGFNQKFDFVTGAKGSPSLEMFTTIYFESKKTVKLRIWTTLQKLKFKITQLDPRKLGNQMIQNKQGIHLNELSKYKSSKEFNIDSKNLKLKYPDTQMNKAPSHNEIVRVYRSLIRIANNNLKYSNFEYFRMRISKDFRTPISDEYIISRKFQDAQYLLKDKSLGGLL
eukprot:gene4091-5119_t